MSEIAILPPDLGKITIYGSNFQQVNLTPNGGVSPTGNSYTFPKNTTVSKDIILYHIHVFGAIFHSITKSLYTCM